MRTFKQITPLPGGGFVAVAADGTAWISHGSVRAGDKVTLTWLQLPELPPSTQTKKENQT